MYVLWLPGVGPVVDDALCVMDVSVIAETSGSKCWVERIADVNDEQTTFEVTNAELNEWVL